MFDRSYEDNCTDLMKRKPALNCVCVCVVFFPPFVCVHIIFPNAGQWVDVLVGNIKMSISALCLSQTIPARCPELWSE